jgi:PD-(D/E)XK nuclease superfamily
MSVTVDPPQTLPVDRLSLSSIRLFTQCPEKWRRRYLEREYEPANGKMILGSAAGAAESQHYATVIETGEGFTTEQVVDEFDHEWRDRISREEIAWGSDSPGELKDSGVKALESYHALIVPQVVPVAVEREFSLTWPGVDWTVIGFLDIEDADGRVRDMKMRGKRMSQKDADSDLQPDLYLAARRAEGQPVGEFVFDTMVRSSKPFAETVTTRRSEARLDRMTDRIFAVAREIEWRVATDNWSGAAPGTWFCGTCTYADCRWRLG